MESYEFSKIGFSDRKNFVEAWEDAFSRRLSSDIYGWIFDDLNNIYVLKENNSIIAGYCLYPFEAIYKKKPSIALLCNNVFVRPGNQGKNLFVSLGKKALNHARENNLGSIAYGIPNRLALPGHKRVGWGICPPINFLEKKRNKYSGQNSKRVRWFNETVPDEIRSGIEKSSIELSQDRDFSVIKTERFFKWRFELKPGVSYKYGVVLENGEVEAYCVCKKYEPDNVVHFLDIDGYSSNAIMELIESVEFLPDGFDRINIWDSTCHKALFMKAGYEMIDKKDNLIMLNIANGLYPVEDGENVNIVLADNDVY